MCVYVWQKSHPRWELFENLPKWGSSIFIRKVLAWMKLFLGHVDTFYIISDYNPLDFCGVPEGE